LSAFEALSFTLAVNIDQQIQCQTTSSSMADLYLQFGAAPEIFIGNYDCFSIGFQADKICTVQNVVGADILWVTVDASFSSSVR